MHFNVGDLLSLAIDLDDRRTLCRQLYQELRQQIVSGRIPPGTRLLSSRVLARELKLSRNTVAEAFSQLTAEGFLESSAGAGTFVSRKLTGKAAIAPAAAETSTKVHTPVTLSARGETVARRAYGVAVNRHAFMPGLPAVDEFPMQAWSQCAAYASRAGVRQLFAHSHPAGDPQLRSAVVAYLRAARGVCCDDDQIFIVAGAPDGIDILCRTLLEPGDTVVVEEPAYPLLKNVLIANGAKLHPQAMDAEGIVLEGTQRVLTHARLVCVTPSHQFPLGTTMSASRRLMLLNTVRSTGAWVLEDDYDSEFRHLGDPVPALQSLDTDGRVIHLGTFSKMLFPSLRLAYMVVPKALIEPITRTRSALGARVPNLSQATLARFMEAGHFTRHLRAMRRLYAARRQCFVEALSGPLSEYLRILNDTCGLHIATAFQEVVAAQADDVRIAAEGAKAGLTLVPLSSFYEQEPRQGGFLLGFASLDEAAIRSSTDTLHGLLAAQTCSPARHR